MSNTKETLSKAAGSESRERAGPRHALTNPPVQDAGPSEPLQQDASADAGLPERTVTQKAISGLIVSLRKVSHFVEVECSTLALKTLKYKFPSMAIQPLNEAKVAKGIIILNFLHELAAFLTVKGMDESGMLWVLLAVIVHTRSTNRPDTRLVLLAQKITILMKRMYRLRNGVGDTEFEWNTNSLADVTQRRAVLRCDVAAKREAFLAMFILHPGASVRQDVGFDCLSKEDVFTELNHLEAIMTTMKNFVSALPNTLTLRFKNDGLRQMAATIEKGIEMLLYDETNEKQQDKDELKDELNTIISALFHHSDLLPDAKSLFRDVPEFLLGLRRFLHTMLLMQPLLGRADTVDQIKHIYLFIHPKPESVQLWARPYINKCAKAVVYEKAPLFSDSFALYERDFRPIEQAPAVKNPYPVDDAKIHSASLAVRYLYDEAMNGIARPGRQYLVREACKAAEKGLDILEANCAMTKNRIVQLGETTLVRNLRHKWALIPGQEENPQLYERIKQVRKRCGSLALYWYTIFEEARDAKNTTAKLWKAEEGRHLRRKRADKARRNQPSKK